MSISFSGLASGLDTSSWVESLVALKKAKVTSLEEQKKEVQSLQETLSQIKSFFSSFRSMLEKVTDAKLGAGSSMDLFAQNLATSSNLEALTAAATSEAEEATYNVKVDKLATETRANSNYSYMTTIVQTTTATADSKLINLGVKAGGIGVTVNGIKHGISITENDTISTFIEKLQNIGVKASYNEKTGIFSVDVSATAIDEGNTDIVKALHLGGVNEGYTSKDLTTTKTDTVYSAATESTKMSELGVKAGTITINANDKDYNIAITNNTTLGDFIKALNDNKIEATLDKTGVFTISDATIKNEGGTGILKALGLAVDIYGKSQVTGNLKHETITTQTTTATTSTKLKELEGGSGIKDGQTVIVKNSNNKLTTITVGTTSTLGDLLTGLTNAGLYAALKSDGTVEISGGTITGGTFKAEEVLGLEKEPYTAMVTGKPLTETVEVHKLVDLSTRLVDDLKVKEGYLEVTDANGDKYYEKIYSGQTIADFMTDMGNLGINTKLDDKTGVLTITGGSFKTLTDADVQALIDNHTITETQDRYKKGTNLLECLYGSGTISTDHITVASTYSKTKALRHTVVDTVRATNATTLGNLGLSGDGTAIFNIRGEERTVSVKTDTTIDDLITKLQEQGIAASWDEDNSRLTIENATLTGGTSNLADILDLTTTVAGKYVTSSGLYAKETIAIDATRDTTLDKYGIANSMSEADRTLKIYDSEGNLKTSTILTETTKIGDILDSINKQDGITAVLNDGHLTISNGYIENATLEASMELKTSNKSSYVLGSVMTVTTTAGVTGESTLKEIFEELGTTSYVESGYKLTFNDNEITVDENTTLNELINKIYEQGGTASLDKTNRLAINGGVLTGSVAQALGMSSTTHQLSVSASGETLYTKTNVFADRSSTFKDLGITGDDKTYTVYNSLDQATTTVTVSDTTTIGDFLDNLKAHGIDGTISNGTIRLTSPNGTYIKGTLPTALGITEYEKTETVNTNQQSTESLKQNVTKTADAQTTLGEIGGIKDGEPDQNILIYDGGQKVIGTITTLTTSSTLQDMFDALSAYDIVGKIENGIISLTSPSGNYAAGKIMENLGVGHTTDKDETVTVGQTTSSSLAITYTDSIFATRDTLLEKVAPTTNTSYKIAGYDSDNNVIKTIEITKTGATIGSLLDTIKNEFGIDGTINNGVISWVSPDGKHIEDVDGTLSDIIKVDSTTTTVGNAASSTIKVTYTQTTAVERTTKLSDLGVDSGTMSLLQKAINPLSEAEATAQGYTCVHNDTELRNALNANSKVILMNDIDINGMWMPIDSFTNIFDGNGYKISNFTNVPTTNDSTQCGFFRVLKGTVKNVIFENATISQQMSMDDSEAMNIGAGILAGYIDGGTVDNIIIKNSSVSSTLVAGLLAGQVKNNSRISNVYTSGTVTVAATGHNASIAGGIVGFLQESLIEKSGSSGTVHAGTSEAYSSIGAGGTVGITNFATIRDTYTFARVTANGNDTLHSGVQDNPAGAIIGQSFQTVMAGGTELSNVTYDSSITENPYGAVSGSLNGTLADDLLSKTKSIEPLVVRDSTGGIIATVDISATATVQDFFDALSPYGISSTIKDGRIVLSSTNGNYITGKIAEKLGIGVEKSTTTAITAAQASTSTKTVTYTLTATEDTKLSALQGVSAGTKVLTINNADGTEDHKITFQASETLGSFITTLRAEGFDVAYTDGILSISSADHKYITGSFITSNLGMKTMTHTVGTTSTSTAAIQWTHATTAVESTKFIETRYDLSKIGTITASGVSGTLIAISTADDLHNLATLVNNGQSMSGKTFILTNDIDLSSYRNWTSIGRSDNFFSGNFDGCGYTISNLTQLVDESAEGQHNIGLFGHTNYANIKNMVLDNFYIEAHSTINPSRSVVRAGAVLGRGSETNISGIEVKNLNISGSGNVELAGIMARSDGATTISNCKTSGLITVETGRVANPYAAGIIAYTHTWNYAHPNVISMCSSDITIKSNVADSAEVIMAGGIVSMAGNKIDIKDCKYSGTIDMAFSAANRIGGVVGMMETDSTSTVNIENCLVTGTYNQTIFNNLGAFVGFMKSESNLNLTNSCAAASFNVNALVGTSGNVVNTGSDFGMSMSSISQTAARSWSNDNWIINTSDCQLKITNDYSMYIGDNYYSASNDITLGSLSHSYGWMFVDGTIAFQTTHSVSGGLADFLQLTPDRATNIKYQSKTLTQYNKVDDITDLNPTLASMGFKDLIGTVTIVKEGTSHTISVPKTYTLEKIANEFEGYGITLSVDNGKVTLSGTENSYVLGMSSNLQSLFKLDDNKVYSTYNTNKDSKNLLEKHTLNGSTTLADLGITTGQTIVVNQNGKSRTIAVSATTTMETLMNTLGAYGVSSSISVTTSGTSTGKFTIGDADDDSYVESISADLMNALKLKVGNGYTYKSSSIQNYTNTTSDELFTTSTITLSTTSTFGNLGFAENETGVVTIKNNDNETFNITLAANNTVGDLIISLAGAGISASVQDGKFTINANNRAYITSMDLNVRNALGLNGDDLFTVNTDYFNNESTEMHEDATFTAKSDTTFAPLLLLDLHPLLAKRK